MIGIVKRSDRLLVVLAGLLSEAREGGYWKLRFPTEEAWLEATFGPRALRRVRQLVRIGDGYWENPGVITELGPSILEIAELKKKWNLAEVA